MKKAYGIAVIIGLALMPWAALGHAQANQPAAPAAAPAEAGPAAIPADQHATPEQIAKLFDLMHIRDQEKAFYSMMNSVMKQQLHQQMLQIMARMAPESRRTPAEEKQFEALMDKYLDRASNLYPIDQMLADMTSIYQRHFSKADMDALIAFYGSPAGQDLLNEQPAIMKEFMPLAMEREQKGIAQLTDDMTKDLAALCKSSAPGPAKKSTPPSAAK